MPPREPTPPRTLVIATHNAGKVAEIEALLAATPWECRGLPAGAVEFPEDGDTFAANARGKARFYARLTGALSLADDSGLEIEALGGEPGVRSARYIDPAISQAERNDRVLERLRGVPPPRRAARFVCHACVALPNRLVFEQVGHVSGSIVEEPRGKGGFGYDPIFAPDGLNGRTFAEISRAEKSSISHRGRAIRQLIERLKGWNPADDQGVS